MLGTVGVEGWSSGGVDIGRTDTRVACEYGGHTERHNHELPGSIYSSGKRVPRMPKRQWYVKDGLNTKSEENSSCVKRRTTVICFHGAHRHTHTFIHGLLNQALRTARLSVTIWKNFRRNRRARCGGWGSVLSVPWKSASFGGTVGCSRKAGLCSVGADGAGVGGIVGLKLGIAVAVSLQLGIRLIAVWWLKRTRFAGGWVPNVRCTRGIAAAPSTIAIRVFQRGLGRRYIRGER